MLLVRFIQQPCMFSPQLLKLRIQLLLPEVQHEDMETERGSADEVGALSGIRKGLL